MKAFREVPAMSRMQFEKIAMALFTLANQLSTTAYQNIQQARFITERNNAEEALHIQTIELEQEVAERQMAQEALQEQANLLKEEAEKRQEAQEELEVLNENLEQRVQERTTELSEKNAEVQQAYEDLKKVQGQLLQQDKMASVGQLAAGVAHEINNPMGFIISNLGSLGKYVEKLTAYLEADEKVLTGCDPAIREMAAQERQKYKIDHICRDMPELISESSDGAQRVRQIVQDLKSFSRVDGTQFATADINEGLDSTLSIAWNELKYKATVSKEYGQLPYVWCNMGQLNQVFLNILVNAAHAIEDQGQIRIRTWSEGETVRIAISDTGGGIQPENLKRIFDPFFTTKEVGKGTGLGLAIAYDIITNKHNGTIEVQSEVGTGTTFTITLPVENKNKPDGGGDLHE
jgi:signal transduction histidine kinase